MISLRKVIKLIIDIITCILIGIVSIYLVFAVYNKFINKDGKFSIGKYYIFQIATGSMEHELFAGDYIVVEKTDNYKVGDIITYKENDYYITHRINKMDGNQIVTKGDANNSSDNPISRDKIVGKFLFKERILTYLTKYKVLFFAILIALIIIESVFSKEKNKKESEETSNNNEEKVEVLEILDEEDISIKKENENKKEDEEIL